MPLSNMLFLTAVISAFCIFGVVLAWGEYQTRNFKRPEPESEPVRGKQDLKKHNLKRAA